MSGLLNQATQAVTDAANYVSETVQGKGAEASATANKETVKSDNASLSTKANAAVDYLGDKKDQKSHEGKAELHKEKAENR